MELPRVLVVDRNPLNLDLLRRFLEQAGYGVLAAADYDSLDAAIGGEERPSVALLDLAGLDEGVWTRCDRLRALGIPFLIVSAWKDARAELQGLSRGACGVLFKPIGTADLLSAIAGLAAARP